MPQSTPKKRPGPKRTRDREGIGGDKKKKEKLRKRDYRDNLRKSEESMAEEAEEERARCRERVAKHRHRQKEKAEVADEEEKERRHHLLAQKAVEKLRTRLDKNLG